jgi:hypothetical protein
MPRRVLVFTHLPPLLGADAAPIPRLQTTGPPALCHSPGRARSRRPYRPYSGHKVMHDPTPMAEQDHLARRPCPQSSLRLQDRILASGFKINDTHRERTTPKAIIAEPVCWRIGQPGNIGLDTGPISRPVSSTLAHFLPTYRLCPKRTWERSGGMPPWRIRSTDLQRWLSAYGPHRINAVALRGRVHQVVSMPQLC